MYVCERPPGLLIKRNVDFALNITERGRRGSNCILQICVSYENVAHRIPSNVCETGECLNVHDMTYAYLKTFRWQGLST